MDDHGDMSATATQLEIGAPKAGVLDSDSDVDVFRFDLIGRAEVTIRTSGPTDTMGKLLTDAGTQLASDDETGPASNFNITAELDPGIYYVAVSGNPGNYAVDAQIGGAADHGGTPETSTRLRLVSAEELAKVSPTALLATSGRMRSGDDVDVFRLVVPRDAVDVAIRTLPAAFDTYGRLLDAAGNEIAVGAGSGAFRIHRQLDAGVHYVEVRARERGAYRILAQGDGGMPATPKESSDDHGDALATSTELAVGPPLAGRLNSGSDVDVFRIDLLGRAELVIRASGPTDTDGTLRTPDGTLLATDADGGPGGNFSITVTLHPGIYYLSVSGSAGEYAVDARVAAATDHGDTRESSTNVRLLSAAEMAAVQPPALLATAGRIQDTDDIDTFRFVVTGADTDVTIRTAPGAFNTNGRLLDAFGTVIAVDETQGGLHITERLDAGIYYVEVTALEPGGYRLLISGEPAVVDADGDGVVDSQDAFPTDASRQTALHGISTTVNGQVILQLGDELPPDNLFDLEGRSVLFTPDGAGRFAREVGALAWEESIGQPVADGAKVDLNAFSFPFGGQARDSFRVSLYGALTFGARSPYARTDFKHHRFAPMAEFASLFAGGPPAITPFFKPLFVPERGSQHVNQLNDRVVITWYAYTYDFGIFGEQAVQPEEFQAVLLADGRIQLNYRRISERDALVGVFPDSGITKRERLFRITDPIDFARPAHIDVRSVDVFATNTDAFIVELALRGPLRQPTSGSSDHYHVHIDTDEPFWTTRDWPDADVTWRVDREPDGTYVRGPGSPNLLSEEGNRIVFTAYPGDFTGGPATVFALAYQLQDDVATEWDHLSHVHTIISVSALSPDDLSSPAAVHVDSPHEVFHWPAPMDVESLVCRLIDVLGDNFDAIAFHSEFRVDFQEAGSSYTRHGIPIGGIGPFREYAHPCSDGRLAGNFEFPVWMKSRFVYQSAPSTEVGRFAFSSWHFAHEFGHTWSAFASFDNAGTKESLFELFADKCRCHWRLDLHSPAAFPWDPDEPHPSSTMGGSVWQDNGDGTWTPYLGDIGGGFSWFDLYLMGLADPSEIPDTFFLPGLPPSPTFPYPRGRYVAEPQALSISQVIAAEGPRDPAHPQTQTQFNAAFVYLPKPGQEPDPDLLALHARFVDNAVKRWSRTTGGRSTLTTDFPTAPDPTLARRWVRSAATDSSRPVIPQSQRSVPPFGLYDSHGHPASLHRLHYTHPPAEHVDSHRH